MDLRDDSDDDEDRPSWRRMALPIGSGVVVLAVLVAGVVVMLSGDQEPPRKINEPTIVTILPPPPPPPPPLPPPEREPEQQVVEQTPVKQEIIEEKAVETPKDAPSDPSDAPPDGPPALDADGNGPGELLGKKGGRGLIGSGGGDGGGGGTRWGWYASIVQAQIESALRSNEKTRHAVMRIQVRLWADGTGRVNRVQLVSSTGNSELDSVLRDQVLGGLTLREPPPRDMPMPIITRVTARSPS
ncbi:energy transducer TonB [Rhodopseudomonas palustris]|uniref:Energy transducer TonB n=1 Tax=Rhodopseudomonas palustris TaxID=1076 RepID=A0A323UNE3_RHOPL|nr:TonB C-terminal domain-containing protein [Rhodopseudomonas palustris]PZA13603.1 energy transducer TonB [Rhodopseudomonas palustris]